MRGEEQVQIGSRALDILIALVERPGTVVTKQDLARRAWPDIIVEESTLRVHIANLRRLLGDGREDARYILNVTGRGYCFVGKIVEPAPPREQSSQQESGIALVASQKRCTIGRDTEIDDVLSLLSQHRLVTIKGAPGVGKSAVAQAIAMRALATPENVWTIQINAGETEQSLFVRAAASLGGSALQSETWTETKHKLAECRGLLVLDGCEAAPAVVASFVEQLLAIAQAIIVLGTSRQSLAVRHEYVYDLRPLATPTDTPMSPEEMAQFPAVRMFLDQMSLAGIKSVHASEASSVAYICRALDGLPLALEVAAGRVPIYGLRETCRLVDTVHMLGWKGRRTVAGVQFTLKTTIGQCVASLTEATQQLLPLLAHWSGEFSLQLARQMAGPDTHLQQQTTEAIDELVAKSVLTATQHRTETLYRFPQLVRMFLRAHIGVTGDGDTNSIRRSHANACLSALKAGQDRIFDERTVLANVREALRWSLDAGELGIGSELAAAGTRLFLCYGHLEEFVDHIDALIARADGSLRPTIEMQLRATRGSVSIPLSGWTDEAIEDLEQAIALANQAGDVHAEFSILELMHQAHYDASDLAGQVATADRGASLVNDVSEQRRAAAAALSASCNLLSGSLGQARASLAMPGLALAWRPNAWPHANSARQAPIILARTAWLQGDYPLALTSAREGLLDDFEDPLTACRTIAGAAGLYLLGREDADAAGAVERLTGLASRHGLRPYLALAEGFSAQLLLRNGDRARGVKQLRLSLADLRAHRFFSSTPVLSLALCEELRERGLFDQALALINEQIAAASDAGPWLLPELLRLRGEILVQAGNGSAGELHFNDAETIAAKQGAQAWLLRTSMSRARFCVAIMQEDRASRLLSEVLRFFPADRSSPDLVEARALLEALREEGSTSRTA